MRRTTFFLLTIVSFTLVVVACSSDPGNQTPGLEEDGTAADVDETDGTTIPDTTSDAGMDTSPSDTPTGEDGGTDATDDGGMDGSSDKDGTGGDDGGISPDAADGGSEMDTSPPTSFGPGSFVRNFYIDDKKSERDQRPNSDPRCCFDVDGDGSQDNAVADFLAEFGSTVNFGLDTVNDEINQRITSGSLVYLFEHKRWANSGWQNDSTIDTIVHPGVDHLSPYDDNLNGNGQFDILSNSYNANGNPKSVFTSAETSPDGSQADLSAQGGMIRLPLTFGLGLSATMHIHKAKMTANVPANRDLSSGGTVPLQDAKLGGAIPKSDFYAGVNEAVSSCSCYDANNKLIKKQGPESYTCSIQFCCSGETTSQIELGCTALRSNVASRADVNLNSSSSDPDALSFGASFKGVGAELVGVAP